MEGGVRPRIKQEMWKKIYARKSASSVDGLSLNLNIELKEF